MISGRPSPSRSGPQRAISSNPQSNGPPSDSATALCTSSMNARVLRCLRTGIHRREAPAAEQVTRGPLWSGISPDMAASNTNTVSISQYYEILS